MPSVVEANPLSTNNQILHPPKNQDSRFNFTTLLSPVVRHALRHRRSRPLFNPDIYKLPKDNDQPIYITTKRTHAKRSLFNALQTDASARPIFIQNRGHSFLIVNETGHYSLTEQRDVVIRNEQGQPIAHSNTKKKGVLFYVMTLNFPKADKSDHLMNILRSKVKDPNDSIIIIRGVHYPYYLCLTPNGQIYGQKLIDNTLLVDCLWQNHFRFDSYQTFHHAYYPEKPEQKLFTGISELRNWFLKSSFNGRLTSDLTSNSDQVSRNYLYSWGVSLYTNPDSSGVKLRRTLRLFFKGNPNNTFDFTERRTSRYDSTDKQLCRYEAAQLDTYVRQEVKMSSRTLSLSKIVMKQIMFNLNSISQIKKIPFDPDEFETKFQRWIALHYDMQRFIQTKKLYRREVQIYKENPAYLKDAKTKLRWLWRRNRNTYREWKSLKLYLCKLLSKTLIGRMRKYKTMNCQCIVKRCRHKKHRVYLHRLIRKGLFWRQMPSRKNIVKAMKYKKKYQRAHTDTERRIKYFEDKHPNRSPGGRDISRKCYEKNWYSFRK